MNSEVYGSLFFLLDEGGVRAVSSFEDRIQLHWVEFPLHPMQDVPGTDAMNVVGDCRA